jgi:hypothetical protein
MPGIHSSEFIERVELLLDSDLYFILYVVQGEDDRITLLNRLKELIQEKGFDCVELNLESLSLNHIRGPVIIHESSPGVPYAHEFGLPSWWKDKPFGILVSGLPFLTEENNGFVKVAKLLSYLPSVFPYQYIDEERKLPKGSVMRSVIVESQFLHCNDVIKSLSRRLVEAVMAKKVIRDEAGIWRRIEK